MTYNWQLPDWPNFIYNPEKFEDYWIEFVKILGETKGMSQVGTVEQQTDFAIELMVSEAIKTSEIEGEFLSREDVSSSVRKNLGILTYDIENVRDQRAKGIAKLMVDVRNSFREKLTEAMLADWHKLLMSGNTRINSGTWRSGSSPMQVISGSIGREIVHFEAPPSHLVDKEMARFIDWYNISGLNGKNLMKNPLIRSSIVHLYFESIHPFEDGNGRIGRAISEKALAEDLGHPVLLSLSTTIQNNKGEYYNALKKAQRTNQINEWIDYFCRIIIESQKDAKNLIEFTLKKTRFFDHYQTKLNERQLKVLNRMMSEGPKGFKGGMTARKYISIAKTSKSTATRDLQNLAELGILLPSGGGRSVSYRLNYEI